MRSAANWYYLIMRINVAQGRYVIAVSGGVDSVVLLDMLAAKPELELVVAHFNHGIRKDSDKDEKFVASLAEHYGLIYESKRGNLGPNASEDHARKARYKFLTAAVEKHSAKGLITAHHQDDLIETAVINILRGTAYRGLASMKLNKRVWRPLLDVPKAEILAYAKKHNLEWREDVSNKQDKYLRNYIRHHITKKMKYDHKKELLKLIDKAETNSRQINQHLAVLSKDVFQNNELDRQAVNSLPSSVAAELLASILRQLPEVEINQPLIERLLVVIKTAAPGSQHDIATGYILKVDKKRAIIRGKSN